MTRVFTASENNEWAQKLPGKMSSACMVLKSDDQVLMVKARYKDHWTFPSGIVDGGESPKAAAIRETNEEVGIAVNEEACSLLTTIYTSSNGSDRDRFNFAFIAEVNRGDISLSVPNDEIEAAAWVYLDEVGARAGARGSYEIFQQFLVNPEQRLPYKEVHPLKQ